MKKRIKRRKRGPVVAKKVIYDGIKFASGLEKYMYIALKKAKIKAKYEGETYTIQEGFEFDVQSYERQSNGKGEFKNRGNKKILPIKYTPDFVSNKFINNIFNYFITKTIRLSSYDTSFSIYYFSVWHINLF